MPRGIGSRRPAPQLQVPAAASPRNQHSRAEFIRVRARFVLYNHLLNYSEIRRPPPRCDRKGWQSGWQFNTDSHSIHLSKFIVGRTQKSVRCLTLSACVVCGGNLCYHCCVAILRWTNEIEIPDDDRDQLGRALSFVDAKGGSRRRHEIFLIEHTSTGVAGRPETATLKYSNIKFVKS